ncbi:sce7725 family protein [Pedobacter sp. PWIIR3]
MYLPYLRGKQYELLALRELCTLPLDNSRISPIIEPIKKDLKSVETALIALNRIGIVMQLIVNPEHGELKGNGEKVIDFIDKAHAMGLHNVVATYLIASERDFLFFQSTATARGYLTSGYSLVHLNQISSVAALKTLVNATAIRFNVIHVNHQMSLKRGFTSGGLTLLSDPFNKQKKNSDYLQVQSEFFSNDYMYFAGEGFHAFSDYLTIGADYAEGGMLPYAVAIHLTYKDKNSGEIWIKHFTSVTNDDYSDTPGKFGEALDKLITFIDAEGLHTIACEQFRDYHSRGAFPGLGVVKKLSIMHHIELIQGLI